MRTLLLSLFLLATPLLQASGPGAPPAAYDALVVLQIDGFDQAALDRLAKVVGPENDLSLEYSCTWADVVVLQVRNTSFSERADVITYVRRYLEQAGIQRGIEVLHVHVEEQGMGKC